MKKMFFTLVLTMFCYIVNAQPPLYYEMKGILKGQGYTIVEDKYADLSQGESTYFYKTFYSGVEYKILGFSDDNDVQDLDIYIYYTNGSEYTKDTDADATPVVTFSPSYNREMKVILKNYRSNTPYYSSRCRFFIAFR